MGVVSKDRSHLEILLRMIDEDGNVIPPVAFMPAAERYGLMPDIDRWVIHEVFKYIGKNNPAHPVTGSECVFAVNLSGYSVNDSGLLEYILEQKKIRASR